VAAGGALGAALFAWYQLVGKPRDNQGKDVQHGSLLGPHHSEEETRAYFDSQGAVYEHYETEEALCDASHEPDRDGEHVEVAFVFEEVPGIDQSRKIDRDSDQDPWLRPDALTEPAGRAYLLGGGPLRTRQRELFPSVLRGGHVRR
jgi:hypothetical protein